MDRDRPDALGEDEDEDAYDDELDEGGGHRGLVQAALAPEALALSSLVLATVSLLGIGLLNGMLYLPPAYDQGPEASDLLAPALLGAALALLPLTLGAWALRRLPEDSRWRPTAGAGVVVAAVSVVLRLVIAARTTADDGLPFAQF